jgi:hypothetical protein
MKFAITVTRRVESDGKAGVFSITDMSSFFGAERIGALIEYEQTVPKKMDFRFKAIRAYHKDDFANLFKEQQETVISSHNPIMT